MKPPVVSEAEAQKASRKSGTWKPGWYPSRIDAALEKLSNAGNETFELTHLVRNTAGDERTIRHWLTATNFGLRSLRHAIQAVGCLEKYNAGEEINQEDFAGADVEVLLAIEKKGGFTRNVIVDYRAASSSSVVNLRSAIKAVAFAVGVGLAASSLGGCAGVDPYARGQGGYVDPGRYQDFAQRYAEAEASSGARYPRQPVASSPSRHNFSDLAMGAGVGAAGGMIAGRMMSSGARTGPPQAMIAEGVAEHAAEQRAAALSAERAAGTRAAERVAVGAAERSVVARGAAVAGAAVVGAEALEALEGFDLLLLFFAL